MSKALLYDATCASVANNVKVRARSKTSCPTTIRCSGVVQSEHKYTVVMTKDDKFMRRLCMHCEIPPARRLSVGAFHKTKKVQSCTTSGSALAAGTAWSLAHFASQSTNGVR